MMIHSLPGTWRLPAARRDLEDELVEGAGAAALDPSVALAPGGLSRKCRVAFPRVALRLVRFGHGLVPPAGWVPRAAAALRAHAVARCAMGMVDGPLMVQRV